MSTQVAPVRDKKALLAKRDEILQTVAEVGDQIKALAPRGASPELYVASLRLYFATHPELLSCTPASIVQGILRVAQTGLDLGVSCDLLPFKGHVQFNVRYNGIVELALAAGTRAVGADVVREGDEFEMRKGIGAVLRHVPSGNLKAKITGAYAIAEIKPGSYVIEYVSRAQIEERKQKYSRTWKNTSLEEIPWYGRKTAIRTLAPYLPKNQRLAAALQFAAETEDELVHGEPVIPATIDDPDELYDPEKYGDAFRDDEGV